MVEFGERRFRFRETDIADFPRVIDETLREFPPLDGERQQAISGLVDFAIELYRIPRVDAVALLLAEDGIGPTTLVAEVFTPIQKNNEQYKSTFKAVLEADGRMARNVGKIFPGSLSFVNTLRLSVESLIEPVQQRWSREGLELVALLEFDRS